MTNEIIADLVEDGQKIQVLPEGGRGGLGNINFKSSTNQAPRYAKPGAEGEELEVFLELKLLADIAHSLTPPPPGTQCGKVHFNLQYLGR